MTKSVPPALAGAQWLTREALATGDLLRSLRDSAPPCMRFRSDAELESTLAEALSGHAAGDDLHVFGYGSLMWNPALHTVDTRLAHVPGWHRRFCLRMLMGRGSIEHPGAMLALDRGGACHGVLLRIAAGQVRDELALLWRREMLAGAYDARWVTARVGGSKVRALTFVANRAHERYIAHQPVEEIARLIRTGQGALGNARSYFDATVQTLERLGIQDRGMARLRRAVLAADGR